MTYLLVKDVLSFEEADKTFKNLLLSDNSLYKRTTPDNLVSLDYSKYPNVPAYVIKHFVGTITEINETFDFNLMKDSFSLREIIFDKKNFRNRIFDNLNLKNLGLGTLKEKFLLIKWPGSLDGLYLADTNLSADIKGKIQKSVKFKVHF